MDIEAYIAVDQNGDVVATLEIAGGPPGEAERVLRLDFPTATVMPVDPSDRREIAKDHAPWKNQRGVLKNKNNGRVVNPKAKGKP